MDFDFTPEQEAFRKEVQQWLEQNLPDDLRGRAFAASRADREEVRKLRTWQKRMYEAGYVGMDWPREFGAAAPRWSSRSSFTRSWRARNRRSSSTAAASRCWGRLS